MCSVKRSVVSTVSYEVEVCCCIVRSSSVGGVVRSSSVGGIVRSSSVGGVMRGLLSDRPSQLHLADEVKDYFRSSLNLLTSCSSLAFHSYLIIFLGHV